MLRRHGIHVESSIVKKLNTAKTRLERRSKNIPRVTQSVDVTDFIAVKSRDRQFGDAKIPEHELNDNFGVEMKVVRVFFEWHLGQRLGRVKPVTGMELGQRRPENAILEPRQNLVANPFVSRHSAGARRAFIDHARAEDRFGLAGQQRLQQIRQFFGGVLAIAVHEGHDVEAMIDGVAVAELLVAAVPLVHRRF